MNLEEAVKYVDDKLWTYCFKKALNDEEYEMDFNFVEPFLVFLSQQNSAVPFGAVIGGVIGSDQDKLFEAELFLEVLVETDIVVIKCVNGNWLVQPLNIEHEVHKALGCDVRPLEVDKVFCGNTLHKPEPTRTDHLKAMQSIKFKVNKEFVQNFPEIPENAPYKRTLPGLLENSGTLYLEHKFDTRGRTYCSSHLNYQGTEYEKCLLQFAKEQKVTDQGRANILEYVKTLKDDEQYLKSVAVQALNSEKTGIFIGADASASGIQLMSVLRGCEKSAESVGLLADNDFYMLAEQESNLEVNEGMDPRKVFKQCSMQHFYGGTKTPKRLLGESNLPKFYQTLWELAPGCQMLLEELQMTYHAKEVFSWTLPDGFQVSQPVLETKRVELSMPNYPEVTFGYAYKRLIAKDKGLEMAANVVHSVDGYVARELIYRAKQGGLNIDRIALTQAYKAAGSYDDSSTVFSLYKLNTVPKDKWAMLGKSFLKKAMDYAYKMVEMPEFDVISIHDDFKCHPNYLNWVKELYIEVLADIADSTLIKEIIEEIKPSITYTKVPSTDLAYQIRNAYSQGTGAGLQ